jgi:hypothetical protein
MENKEAIYKKYLSKDLMKIKLIFIVLICYVLKMRMIIVYVSMGKVI